MCTLIGKIIQEINPLTRLFACGDSFTYGHELSDCPSNNHPTHSMLTYSALTAKHLGTEYVCLAECMAANNSILKQIESADITANDTVLVMWTFAQRYALMLDQGYYTLGLDEHKWWWTNVDQSSEQCLNRTTDFILAGHQILNKIGCNYIFLCNNIELQNKIQYNTSYIGTERWMFLDKHDEMINHDSPHTLHPGDSVHNSLYKQLVKAKLNG